MKEIFDKNHIDHWLIYGALLGLVREGRLLTWDSDIDIAIWEKNLADIEKVLDSFHRHNISVHFTESGHVTFNRDSVHISAMVFSKNDDKAVRSTFTNTRKFRKTVDGIKHYKGLDKTTQMLKYIRWILSDPEYIGDPPHFISYDMQKVLLRFSHIVPCWLRVFLKKTVENILSLGCTFFVEETPIRFFTELSYIDFYGLKVKAPKDQEGYLRHKYGINWRIPQKDYVYYLDSKSERRVMI